MKPKGDSLGDRMKTSYEDRTRFSLPRRTYTIVRVDGKAFHSYTRPFARPFDEGFVSSMDEAAKTLCAEMQGCVFGYGQSDEYSFLLADFERDTTDAWFDGNLQKITSISASTFTAAFLSARWRGGDERIARFDARAFTIPDPVEVENYFIWREQDASRNSINMVADCYYSDRELQGKSSNERQEMLFAKGINWNDFPIQHKRGRVIRQEVRPKLVEWTHKKTKEQHSEIVQATEWEIDLAIPVFTKDRDYLRNLIPRYS